ncbi:MAG: cytochrome c [Magnetococcales bacterium]|nr:cytochrome c [Magnetococcales bacterium]
MMSILRLHLKAIETLAANQKHQYAENMLRHATALRSSAQLLDHVYPDRPENRATQAGSETSWNDRKGFDDQVERSLKATKELVKASEQWMKGHREPMTGAIKSVRESCDSCHKIFRAH